MTAPTMLPDKLFFKVSELADILQVEKKTLYSWIDTGRLDAVKIGGWAVRVTREAALKLIKEAHD